MTDQTQAMRDQLMELALDQIETEVAAGLWPPMRLFTTMRQLVNSARAQSSVPAGSEPLSDGDAFERGLTCPHSKIPEQS